MGPKKVVSYISYDKIHLFFRPPRPRPEGGQDPSPNFLNEGELPGSAAVAAAGFKENLAPHNSGKKQDDLLIIDSWTGKKFCKNFDLNLPSKKILLFETFCRKN